MWLGHCGTNAINVSSSAAAQRALKLASGVGHHAISEGASWMEAGYSLQSVAVLLAAV